MSYTLSPDGLSITCGDCGLTSWHQEDVKQRYCGKCHRWHEDQEDDAISMWTIYERPTDHPEMFVVRRWMIPGGVGEALPCESRCAATLEAARAMLPTGAVRLQRDLLDDPKIVESWL